MAVPPAADLVAVFVPAGRLRDGADFGNEIVSGADDNAGLMLLRGFLNMKTAPPVTTIAPTTSRIAIVVPEPPCLVVSTVGFGFFLGGFF